MKKFTFLWCLLLCLTTAMNAQTLQTKSSINDLLTRYSQLGAQKGSVSDYFTKEEQQMLRSYLSSHKAAMNANDTKAIDNNTTDDLRKIAISLKNSASVERRTPLFVAPEVLSAENEAEILADKKYQANLPVGFSSPINNMERNPLSDITPTAGATETFNPAVGDNFFDPGGPGGANTDGTPGNYPNCGCDTQSTLAGVSEIEFLDFGVNGTFDYLRIYDGTDATGTVLYDNSDTGANSGDKTLADMIASNGSASFTAASENFFFFFHSSSVVNWLGWDVEIVNATGGGGGGTFPDPYCAVPFSSVEAITLVDVAGISNVTDPASTIAHEDFTAISGDMEEGMTYPIALEGNTAGSYTNSFTVFIDWNQDGILDNDSERYEIGTINSSSGTDGQQATGDIIVPAGVTEGTTRMRVVKRYSSTGAFVTDACTPGTSFGQAEDYSINVTTSGGGGGGGACSQADLSNGFENGQGNTNNTVEVADEIIVAADTDFEVTNLTINLINNGGFNTIQVGFYKDAGGMPGALVGSIMTVTPTSSTVIGTAFARDVNEVVMDFATPVALPGTAGSETVYWIGIETPDPVDPTSDTFWETTSVENSGTDYRVHYDIADQGWIATEASADMWNTVYNVSGNCEPITGGGGPGPLTTVYGINNATQDLIGFATDAPENAEVFGTSPITVNFENAGAIDPANPTTGYVLDNGGQFYSFDVTTGLYTSLGTIAGDWTGMEYDLTTGILYGIAGADLYTIDPAGISATLVGSLGLAAGALPVAIAIDGAGVGYTYDLVDANLYSIDLSTGAATLVGPIGFGANFGQGMLYDPTTDTVYMAAFNGDTFLAEWRSVDTATGNTTFIGNLVDPNAQVAWASVGETLPPPACPKPTNLTVTNITETTADLNWDAEPNAGNGYVWYVFDEGADPITATPAATGTTPSGTTTVTATGLTNGTSYDFYVVADCDTDGLSNLAGPITFATEITPPACGGKFYDNGGPGGDYANSSNDTTTINPDVTGNVVTVTFTSFNVEATWDALYVYNGPDATFPLISSGNPATNSGFPAGGYYGTDLIGPFTSTDASGALTFVFMSDGSVPKAGWEADVTCTTPAPANDMIANSIDVDVVGFPYTDSNVQMPFATTEGGNPNGCDLTGANGVWYNFVPTGDGTAIASIVSPSGASSVTFYTAPNESAVETDLTLVDQNSNQCGPGTSATINTVAGQAYYVFVLNTGSATDITIDGTNLGVSDNTIAGFTFYPNPSIDILNLRSVDNIESVSIYNMLGQQVISNKVDASSSQLNVSSLSTGTYLMKVTVNGQTGTYRVLKN